MQDGLAAAEKQLHELADELAAAQRKAADEVRLLEEEQALKLQKLGMERAKMQVRHITSVAFLAQCPPIPFLPACSFRPPMMRLWLLALLSCKKYRHLCSSCKHLSPSMWRLWPPSSLRRMASKPAWRS